MSNLHSYEYARVDKCTLAKAICSFHLKGIVPFFSQIGPYFWHEIWLFTHSDKYGVIQTIF